MVKDAGPAASSLCTLFGGAPFKVEVPKFNAETPAVMEDFKEAYSVWLKRGIDD